MKFNYTSVVPHMLSEESTEQGIGHLISEMLILKQKLDNPDAHSEYFRWGLESQTKHYDVLKNQYRTMRAEFNQISVDEILEDRTSHEQKLNEIMQCKFPVFAKNMLWFQAKTRIGTMNDFLSVKSVCQYLPEISDLKEPPDLIARIIIAGD